ncbi:TonB-dependent receptor [Novosphingobium sp. Rr 2-17]|uniref:TonB-dependent receptor n=1 Tax=Novosphingobium sp. Rr 2-17 TaxID=555793 RepID=UPI0006943165|nr:TonB-dependent receptor [Novosphingobium sp. Rr 2-17]
MAQTAKDANASSSSADATGNAATEIVVTAQFRRQSVQSAPIAITALSGEMLEARNQTTIIDAATRVPSVTLTQGGSTFGNSVTASIRGVGQYDSSFALEPGVGMYIDDVYYGALFGSAFDLLDLSRVEVLRGPQGTLAGKNSIGGAIKLFSQPPEGSGDAYAEAGYGSYNRVNVRAGIDLPLIADKLFARASFGYKRADGYLTNYDYGCLNPGSGVPSYTASKDCVTGHEGGQEATSGRLALRWVAAPGIEDTLTFGVSDDRSQPPATKLIYANNPDISINGVPYDSRFLTGSTAYSNYANYLGSPKDAASFTVPRRSTALVRTVSNNLSADMGGVTLKSITAYIDSKGSNGSDNDLSPVDVQVSSSTRTYKQFTQELRLSGLAFADRLDWTVGAYYYRATTETGGRQDLQSSGLDFLSQDTSVSTSKAAFAHGIVSVTDTLKLIGGLRYNDDRKTYTFNRLNPDGSVPACAEFFPGCTPNYALIGMVNQTGHYAGTHLDYRIGVEQQWTSDVMTYAQVSTGYKVGGINPRAFFTTQITSFASETLTAYEVGLKSYLFDRRLRLNLAAYHNVYNDVQLTLHTCDAFSPFPGAPCAMPVNGGNAKIDGVELETELRPGGGLTIDGSASLLRFEYTQLNPGTGITKDMIAPYTPTVKLNAGVQYAFELGNLGTLTPRVDWTYQNAMYTATINESTNRIAAYDLTNASIAWESSDKAWLVRLAASNLFDKFYYFNSLDQHSTTQGGYITGQPGAPRQVLLTVRRRLSL